MRHSSRLRPEELEGLRLRAGMAGGYNPAGKILAAASKKLEEAQLHIEGKLGNLLLRVRADLLDIRAKIGD